MRIGLGDGTHAFARVLPNSQVAIYSHRGSEADALSPSVFGSEILWKLTVMKSALISGRWPVVDYRPLESELLCPVEYFVKDRLSGRYSVYRSSDGHTRESNFEECKALEAAAAWEAEHVEDRLRDYFAGRANAWTEQLRATP
jgi:hypothetical protein